MRKSPIAFLLALLCLAGKAQIPVSDQFHLDMEELRQHLVNAPSLDAPSGNHSSVKILLPTPDGTLLTFQIWEDPILSADLQQEYPNCHTYALEGEDQPYSGRIMVSPAGLDAVVLCGEQVLFIEAVDAATDLHRAYYWKLGSSYLSFDLSQKPAGAAAANSLRLAVLVDDAYARFHKEDLPHAVFASVNGVNAFLQQSQGVQLKLHYFAAAGSEQVQACLDNGFRGRTGEAIKLFGDEIAAGRLQLSDFDLGHFFSGRGFGGSALSGVAGLDTYYDWNEDGIFDGPAKAGGGLGAARPAGANWWGSLCKEMNRQIGSSGLALVVQQPSAVEQDALPAQQVSAYLGDLEHIPTTMKHYSGPGAMGGPGFPHLSCLTFPQQDLLLLNPQLLAAWRNGALPGLQTSFSASKLWPLWLTGSRDAAVADWVLGWRF